MSSGRLPALLLLLAGCSSTSAVVDQVEIRTALVEYAVDEQIEARVLNAGDRAVHAAHCNHRISLSLERRTAGGDWSDHLQLNGPLCIAIYPAGELRIDPGAVVTDTFRIGDPGEYRLRLYGRLQHEDFGSLVVRSAPFTVR